MRHKNKKGRLKVDPEPYGSNPKSIVARIAELVTIVAYLAQLVQLASNFLTVELTTRKVLKVYIVLSLFIF